MPIDKNQIKINVEPIPLHKEVTINTTHNGYEELFTCYCELPEESTLEWSPNCNTFLLSNIARKSSRHTVITCKDCSKLYYFPSASIMESNL